MYGKQVFVLVAIAAILLAACGEQENEVQNADNGGFSDVGDDDNNGSPPTPGTDDDAGDDDAGDDDGPPACKGLMPFSLLPGARNVPFPNDLFTYEDPTSPTGRRVWMTSGNVATFYDSLIDKWPTLAESMDQMNGFGSFSALLIPVSEEPVRDLLPAGGDPSPQDTVVMLITDPDSSHDGKLWPLDCTWNETVSAIQCNPLYSLPESTTVTVAVLDMLAAGSGNCYRADDHFEYVRATEPDTNHPLHGLLEPYRLMYRPMFEALEAVGIAREHVLSAAQYTTQNVTFDMDSVHDQLAQRAADDPPTWHDVTYTQAPPESAVDVTVEGKLTIPDWRDQDSGWFKRDQSGLPRSTRENEVAFRMTIPKTTGDYAQPFPVAIHGHGILSSTWEVSSMGAFLARYGIAVIGIDFEYCGSRSTGNEIEDALSLVDVFNPAKMRDVQRQSIAELMWVYHVVQNLADLDLAPYATDGDGQFDLDTDAVFYTGHSWGSILSGEVIAFIPEIDTFALSAPAANWETIALESPNSAPYIDLVKVIESELGFSLVDPVLTALQMTLHVIDAVDPAVMAQFYREPRATDPREHINIEHQFIAFDNTLGTNACLEFAFQFGYPQIEPVVVPIPGAEVVDAPVERSGVYQFDTDDHNLVFGSESDPMVAAHHRQLGTYLRSRYDDGTPVIIDPFADE